jgi:2-hydroxy-3-keto-5-methylthiopentenyl-1-phosphate phosphatase
VNRPDGSAAAPLRPVPTGDSPPPLLRVSLDFDGTLVEPNVAKLLVSEFILGGSEIADLIDRDLHAGRITLREAWARQTALLPWDRFEAMARFVRDHVPLRPGAREFLALAKEYRIPVTIVSGGLDFYIREVLHREHLKLPVRADKLRGVRGGRPRLDYPYGHRTCHQCGTCKAGIVTEGFGGSATVLIADGTTDRYAAEVADLVFARGRLLDFCQSVEIPCYEFENFPPVTAQFRRWLEREEEVPRATHRGRAGSNCPISSALAWTKDRPAPSGARPDLASPGAPSISTPSWLVPESASQQVLMGFAPLAANSRPPKEPSG